MKKFEIVATMQRIREARIEWSAKHREVNAVAGRSMRRLIHEAIVQRMSVEEVSRHSGYPARRIREIMRNMGLEPRWSKTLLAETAATALAHNAELLGIDPVDMDLMSPLAYLPAGSQLVRDVQSEATRGVTEVPEIEETEDELVERLTVAFKEGWHSRDEYWRTAEGTGAMSQSDRTQAGIRAVLKAMA